MDWSPPGSSVHGIFQARTLEWVAISFSRGSSLPKDRTQVSCTASRFSTIWATREAHGTRYFLPYYASHFADGKTEAERYIVWGILQGWEQTQVHLGLLSTVCSTPQAASENVSMSCQYLLPEYGEILKISLEIFDLEYKACINLTGHMNSSRTHPLLSNEKKG